MPSLDIASNPSFQNHLSTSRAQPLFHGNALGKLTYGKDIRLASTWKVSIQIPRKVNFDVGHLEMKGALLNKAVATLEPKYLDQSEDGHNLQWGSDSNTQLSQSSNENSDGMVERESLRRMRISKANKGNVPWNKGKKHSAETLRLIRERTKLAMQDPKVKMKLANLGHAQSNETRIKIGVGVRKGWQRRREKLMLQETCCFEWQNLIAEASRSGSAGEVELQWDSYNILDEQLEQEWLESIEQRKSIPRPKGSKRAPKSFEQRKKISEAISAKWADPGYRERVCSALAKYHGTPVGSKRKPKRKPSGGTQSVRKSSVKEKVSDAINGSGKETRIRSQSRLKKRSAAPFKDPLADSKLEMIKNIRAQRADMERKKFEAVQRAKLLIAEAEKAAKALELAAAKSPLARASLMETRKLIAEATHSIEVIETGQTSSHGSKDSRYSSVELNGLGNHYKGADTGNGLISPDKNKVNGIHVAMSHNNGSTDLDFGKFTLQNLLHSGEPLELSSKCRASPQSEPRNLINRPDTKYHQIDPIELNEATNCQRTHQPNGEKTGVPQVGKGETSSTNTTTKKKWVCGRLVEVAGD